MLQFHNRKLSGHVVFTAIHAQRYSIHKCVINRPTHGREMERPLRRDKCRFCLWLRALIWEPSVLESPSKYLSYKVTVSSARRDQASSDLGLIKMLLKSCLRRMSLIAARAGAKFARLCNRRHVDSVSNWHLHNAKLKAPNWFRNPRWRHFHGPTSNATKYLFIEWFSQC